ncbi:uroporphyrinogen-III synthase [Hydrogenophaga atypica]|uniref:Uroporphyrinogen-III synthase n=1 Tax=Hydrogenophaga atypica TaxID=249409 RepID=A0ABW2QG21_9BURK
MKSPAQRVVVTRPADEAGPWQTALEQHGFMTLMLPLIDVAGMPDVAMPPLAGFDAVMWVSGNAVRFFLPAVVARWPSGLRCWAPGPGTAQALRVGGVPAHLIDEPAVDAPQFDSEALWAVVSHQMAPGKRVLLVRGRSQGVAAASSGREWLLQQCAAASAEVVVLPVYERRCPVWRAEEAAEAALAAVDGSVWLFSSGEAVGYLQTLLPGQDWRQTPAVATHPRITLALEKAGFARVRTVRPTVQSVVEALSPA